MDEQESHLTFEYSPETEEEAIAEEKEKTEAASGLPDFPEQPLGMPAHSSTPLPITEPAETSHDINFDDLSLDEVWELYHQRVGIDPKSLDLDYEALKRGILNSSPDASTGDPSEGEEGITDAS